MQHFKLLIKQLENQFQKQTNSLDLNTQQFKTDEIQRKTNENTTNIKLDDLFIDDMNETVSYEENYDFDSEENYNFEEYPIFRTNI